MSNLNFDRGAMARIKKTAEGKARAKWEKMGERRSVSYPKYEASDYANPNPDIKFDIPKPEELKAKSAKPGKLMTRFSVSKDLIAAIQDFVGQQAAANNNPQSQQAFQGWQSEGPAWGGLRKSGLYGDNSRYSDFEILLQDRVAALELSNRILMETVRTLEETITAKVLKRLGAGPLPDLGEQPTPRVLNPSRKIREI